MLSNLPVDGVTCPYETTKKIAPIFKYVFGKGAKSDNTGVAVDEDDSETQLIQL